MKDISYFEVVCAIKSQYIDEAGRWFVIDSFEKEKDAQKLLDKLNKELFEKLKTNPGYPHTHTEYYTRPAKLVLK